MARIILALLLTLPVTAISDDATTYKDWSVQRLPENVTDDFVWMATSFAKCAGLYGSLAAAEKQFFFTSMSSTELMDKYLEATSVSAWLLAEEHYSRTGDKKPVAEFDAHIKDIALNEGKRLAVFLADFSVSDDWQAAAAMRNEADRCAKLNEMQVLMQRLRDLRAELAAMGWPARSER